MANKGLTCAGCLNAIEDASSLNCCSCHEDYDIFCANVSAELYRVMGPEHKSTWKCVLCKSGQPRTDNTNTPVSSGNQNVTMHRGRGVRMPQISPEQTCMEISYTENLQQSKFKTPPNNLTTLDHTLDTPRVTEIQMLVTELRLFREEMRAMSQQLHDLRMAMANLTTRIDGCDGRIDAVCARVEALESRKELHYGQQSESALLETITNLRSELNDRDQDQLQNDIEMSCVPEQRGENVTHVVITLGQKLGVTLTEQDIVDAARVGRTPQLEEGTQGPAARPRLVVVRLARRAVRDRLLQAARVRRGATTEGTGLPGAPSRFYMNERLTPTNRRLFQRTRELKQHHGWRYAWTRDGRIFVRQRSGENIPKHRIRSEQDLDRVFGSLTI